MASDRWSNNKTTPPLENFLPTPLYVSNLSAKPNYSKYSSVTLAPQSTMSQPLDVLIKLSCCCAEATSLTITRRLAPTCVRFSLGLAKAAGQRLSFGVMPVSYGLETEWELYYIQWRLQTIEWPESTCLIGLAPKCSSLPRAHILLLTVTAQLFLCLQFSFHWHGCAVCASSAATPCIFTWLLEHAPIHQVSCFINAVSPSLF